MILSGMKTNVVCLIVLLHCNVIIPHGFTANTLIELQDNQEFLPIENIASRFFQGKTTNVRTYKEKSQKWKVKSVQAVALCQSDIFYELIFTSNSDLKKETIQCSPLQLFYKLSDKTWSAAHELQEGDELLCKNNQSIRLLSKKSVHDRIKLYIIEVKKDHTFLVGHQRIVTHNLFVPLVATLGMSVPFELVFQAGSFGCMFGPVTFCCSLAVGAIATAIAYQCSKEKPIDFILIPDDGHNWHLRAQHNDTNKDINGAQAPGLPTENDGFIPKKNWDGKKVKSPNSPTYGWPDQKGSVWIPTGPKGHGGPHWDVEHPNGDYDNIVPGGKIRGKK